MSAEAVKETVVTTTRKTTVTLDERYVAGLVRRDVNAPFDAEVTFDCGYDILRDVIVTWSVTEDQVVPETAPNDPSVAG